MNPEPRRKLIPLLDRAQEILARDDLSLEDLAALQVFCDTPDQRYRRSLAVRELIEHDFATNGGWGVLRETAWSPGAEGRSVLTGTSPGGRTFRFEVEETSGGLRPPRRLKRLRLATAVLAPRGLSAVGAVGAISETFDLPERWLEGGLAMAAAGEEEEGLQSRRPLDVDVTFVARSVYDNGRRFDLDVYARAGLMERGVVEFLFLDAEGEAVDLYDRRSDQLVPRAVRVVEFGPLEAEPGSPEGRRMAAALGVDQVVAASCRFDIPDSLPGVDKVRLVLRPQTPVETIRAGDFVAIPVVTDGDDCYLAERARDGFGMVDCTRGEDLAIPRVKRGGLLLVAQRDKLVARLDGVFRAVQADRPPEWDDEVLGYAAEKAIGAIYRVSDSGFVGESVEDAEDAFRGTCGNAVKQLPREQLRREKKVTPESKLRLEGGLGDVRSSYDAVYRNCRHEGIWSEVKEFIATASLKDYDELCEFVRQCIREESRSELEESVVRALFETGATQRKVAEWFSVKQSRVKAIWQRVLERIRERFKESSEPDTE